MSVVGVDEETTLAVQSLSASCLVPRPECVCVILNTIHDRGEGGGGRGRGGGGGRGEAETVARVHEVRHLVMMSPFLIVIGLNIHVQWNLS